nr:uncharacterized protein LOC111983975 [Quercus suber]
MALAITLLPHEVVGCIVDYLNLHDIRALRYSCRGLGATVTASSRFRSFCTQKEVHLRVSSLEELTARLSTSDGTECQLEHLTLTGVLWVTKGLERILRDRTKPSNLEDPCGVRSRPKRLPAAPVDLVAAEVQLGDFRNRLRDEQEDHGTGRTLHCLVELFKVIGSRCKKKGLSSLKLSVEVYREQTTPLTPAVGTAWPQIWNLAEQVFTISMQAWERSGVNIERLDVFSGMESCSIQAYDVAILQEQLDFHDLHGLKDLALSISNRVLPLSFDNRWSDLDADDEVLLSDQRMAGRAQRRPRPDQRATAELIEQCKTMLESSKNYIGVSEWLKKTPDLEKLQLRDYLVISGLTDNDRLPIVTQAGAAIQSIADNAPLPKLKQLTLRICADIELEAMMAILRNSPDLESIHLQNVTVIVSNSISWEPVLAHITSPSAKLTHIHLDSLFETEGRVSRYIICFTPGTNPGDSICTGEDAETRLERLMLPPEWSFCRPGAHGYNALELNDRSAVLRGIRHRANQNYIVGSVQQGMWMEQRRQQHGPTGRF